MNLGLLEERLVDYGTGGYYLLETFLLHILRLEAESHGQTLLHSSERSSRPDMDAYAPSGLAELKGPLAIEVAHVLSPRKLGSVVKMFESVKRGEDDCLLVVALRELAIDSNHIQALTARLPNKVVIWGPDRIQSIVDKHEKAAAELLEKLFSVRLKRAVTASLEDWKIRRARTIAEVGNRYRDGRFSIFLGAGVSSSAGLPDWDTLLNSLFVSMLTDEHNSERATDNEEISSIVKRLRQVDGPSALMLARYVRRGLSAGSKSEQNQFVEAVTRQLYGLRDRRFSLHSPLIKAIANLCTPTRMGANVRSVVTYNFDDILERELTARVLNHRSIFEEIDLAAPEELPIYHVHGFLPEDRTKYAALERSTLVFSEEGYHQIYGQPYHWSNLIQLSALKETTCLMVGLSLTDPNLRRLLEIASKSTDRPRHFAFLRRIDLEKFAKEDGKPAIRAPIGVMKSFLERHHSLNEEVMRELGVATIWYESYDEIPAILHQVARGT